MLRKTKHPNLATNLFANPHPAIKRIAVVRHPYHLLLWLAVILASAFFILSIGIPFSSGTAQAPEWSSSSTDRQERGTIDQARIDEDDRTVYLPMAVKRFPVIPLTPELDPISNPDGDGSYTVSWTAVEGAEAYLLQEADSADFSNPSTAYEGAATSKAISGKELGTYYYRLLAYNAYASSEWSNVESVEVNATPPDCPQTGSWRGTTSQGESIEFVVENTPVCQIPAGSFKISWSITLCGSATFTSGSAIPITDDTFNLLSYWVDVNGEFTASDQAIGTYIVDYFDGIRCYYSGSWQAYPLVGANGPVYDLLVQPDEKILMGGNFSEVGPETHHNLARLNPDGSLDSAFSPDFDSSVRALAIQADDKILAGGGFSLVNGETHAGITRLNPDGSLDTGFDAQVDGNVAVLALQSDGKILLGGWFSAVNGQARSSLARLNTDGSLDETFVVKSSYMDLYALEVQPDDKILLGGYIEDVGEQDWADYFVRLNPDGTLDSTFQPDTGGWWVDGIAIQGDGKILAAFYSDLARFNPDGTRDDSFTSLDPLGGSIREVVIQADGALVVGGDFISLGLDSYDYLAQLNSDGTLRTAFNPVLNSKVYTLTIQPDNKILVGGAFTLVDGQVRHSIVRLNPDGSLDLTFSMLP